MNYWTELSIQFANQKNYLDELFKIYPTIPEGIREVNTDKWTRVKDAFQTRNNTELIKNLLTLELFPIKDSYVAYLKRDVTASERNPETVDRLCGRLYEMGIDDIFKRNTEPKETNRQIGPLFKRWLMKGTLGLRRWPLSEFQSIDENAILDGGDAELMRFAINKLGYY